MERDGIDRWKQRGLVWDTAKEKTCTTDINCSALSGVPEFFPSL